MINVFRVIKYLAIGFGIFLIVCIVSLVVDGSNSLLVSVGLLKGNSSNKLEVISDKVSNLNKLEINVKKIKLKIKNGDEFRVLSNNSKIKYVNNGGNIVIDDLNKNILSRDNDLVEIYIPNSLKEIKLNSGAGMVEIEKLVSDKLEFELGAGSVNIGNLVVNSSAFIEGGAGLFVISDGSINNLDLSMGVGEFDIKAKLIGNNKIEAGIGNLDIKLIGEKDDYKIECSKGLGAVSISGDNIKDDSIIGNGNNNIKVSGGIGNIDISFNN